MRVLPVFLRHMEKRKATVLLPRSFCDRWKGTATNVQTACEAGNRARNREFASERVANELRRQQSVQREFASGRVARLSGLIVRKKTIDTI